MGVSVSGRTSRAAKRGKSELARRIDAVRRTVHGADVARLLATARRLVGEEATSTGPLTDDLSSAAAQHRKWQAIHRYVRAVPYEDEGGVPRSSQWKTALTIAREIGDLDLIEWVFGRIDGERAEAARSAKLHLTAPDLEPTYIVFLKAVANRKRKARAALQWAQSAREMGWITCDSSTLGSNLIALHAASVHARDNPDYDGPVEGAYRKD